MGWGCRERECTLEMEGKGHKKRKDARELARTWEGVTGWH